MLFERPELGEKAVIVHLEFYRDDHSEDLAEFRELVSSAGIESIAEVGGQRDRPHSRYFVGTGKLEEIEEILQATDARLVLFNHALSPSQERNLEKSLRCRVLDRTGIILEIFAQRARTHEGKLQVELAQMDHMSTRLVGGWTHLERQKGGAGLRGGPGEKQLELDRRIVRQRIKQINRSLAKVRKQRVQGRRSRDRADIPTASLVGYTNAGKSTLFNTITDAKIYAADQLFATLDPTLRRVTVDDLGPIVLADTVGFIRHLPHKLIEAFRATLEEVSEADLLLHVVDCADERRAENIEQVEDVLKEIKAIDIPTLEVFNKVDLLGLPPKVDYSENGEPIRVWLSSIDNQGIDLLYQAIAEKIGKDIVHGALLLSARQGKLRSAFYEQQVVVNESYDDQGCSSVEIKMPKSDYLRIMAAENIDGEQALSLLKSL